MYKLSNEILKSEISKIVLSIFENDAIPLCTISDNHPTNRSYMKNPIIYEIKNWFPNLNIIHLFDTVHVLQCINETIV